MKQTWKKYLLYGSAIVVGGVLLFIVIQTMRAKNTGFETKTLWDWMELLVIPIVLAIGAFYLQRSERAVERKAAEDRAKLEREIATDRQQEAALQTYLDRMTDLLLRESLRNTKNEEVRNVARIRTLTVLRGLDAKRKGMVVLFLYESGLIAQERVVDLAGADLSQADLRAAWLSEVNLGGVNLSRANLSRAHLYGASLVEVNLKEANLDKANLYLANLWESNLSGVNLHGATLLEANLNRVNLLGGNLEEADLTRAKLGQAKISDKQLATAKTLEGAIMPDGTKHD